MIRLFLVTSAAVIQTHDQLVEGTTWIKVIQRKTELRIDQASVPSLPSRAMAATYMHTVPKIAILLLLLLWLATLAPSLLLAIGL